MVVSLSRIPFPSGFMGQVHGLDGTRERVVSPRRSISSSSVFHVQSAGDYSEYSEYDVHASGRCDSYLTSMLVETIGDRRYIIECLRCRLFIARYSLLVGWADGGVVE